MHSTSKKKTQYIDEEDDLPSLDSQEKISSKLQQNSYPIIVTNKNDVEYLHLVN